MTENHAALKAWGGLVIQSISDRVKNDLGDDRFASFLKIEPGMRVKAIPSVLKKQEKKGYSDPVDMMTDLVGVRFVILLRSDLAILERAIVNCDKWSCSKDRDFEHEIFDDPNVFDYQSLHFVVRNNFDITYDDVTVPEGLACEVQVRTLMQHAYAELVHDNIYKNDIRVPERAKRLVARCMALMESADELFCDVVKEIDGILSTRESLWRAIAPVHTAITGMDSTPSDDFEEVFQTYRDLLGAASGGEFDCYRDSNFYRQRILERSKSGALFADPACLLAYWLIGRNRSEALRNWPLEHFRDDLETICSDLGVSSVG